MVEGFVGLPDILSKHGDDGNGARYAGFFDYMCETLPVPPQHLVAVITQLGLISASWRNTQDMPS